MYEVFVEVTDVLCNQLVVLAYYGSTISIFLCSYSCSIDSEREGFAVTHGKASEVVRREVPPNTSQTGNKDCVIS